MQTLQQNEQGIVLFWQNFSLNSIAYIYLLVKFLFCLFFFFRVYLLPVMVNKDVYILLTLYVPSTSHNRCRVSVVFGIDDDDDGGVDPSKTFVSVRRLDDHTENERMAPATCRLSDCPSVASERLQSRRRVILSAFYDERHIGLD